VVELHGSRVRCVLASKFSVMRFHLHANYLRYEDDKRWLYCIEEKMRYDGFIGVKFVFVVACRWIECGEGRHAGAGARTSIRQSRLELARSLDKSGLHAAVVHLA